MQIRCSGCGGHGLVSHYAAQDFEGAKDCEACDGQGVLYVTKSGRLRIGKSGPFKGRLATEDLQELTKGEEGVA